MTPRTAVGCGDVSCQHIGFTSRFVSFKTGWAFLEISPLYHSGGRVGYFSIPQPKIQGLVSEKKLSSATLIAIGCLCVRCIDHSYLLIRTKGNTLSF